MIGQSTPLPIFLAINKRTMQEKKQTKNEPQIDMKQTKTKPEKRTKHYKKTDKTKTTQNYEIFSCKPFEKWQREVLLDWPNPFEVVH